jgi:hypothetical protein
MILKHRIDYILNELKKNNCLNFDIKINIITFVE